MRVPLRKHRGGPPLPPPQSKCQNFQPSASAEEDKTVEPTAAAPVTLPAMEATAAKKWRRAALVGSPFFDRDIANSDLMEAFHLSKREFSVSPLAFRTLD